MKSNLYPQKIMDGIPWIFSDGSSSLMEDFFEKVYIFQENISAEIWDPSKIELYSPSIYITFSFWNILKEKDQTKGFLLKTENDNFFSNGELLFKIHNYVENDLAENQEEHIFFGGLIKKSDIDMEIKQVCYELILLS